MFSNGDFSVSVRRDIGTMGGVITHAALLDRGRCRVTTLTVRNNNGPM